MKKPFSISPNPLTLYLTPGLKSIIAKVRYTIDRRQGLTCILGDVGMGKSTVLRFLYAEYQAKPDMVVLFIPTPEYSSEFAFMKSLSGEFNIPPRKALLDQTKDLQAFLLKQFQQGKNVAVFIDEAQRLNGKMLEQIRAMLNFETNTDKLVNLVLAGQMELRDRLRDPTKKAIKSRIFAASLLAALSFDEMKAMINFRCTTDDIEPCFSDEALQYIYEGSSGVPRDVLKLCAMSYEIMEMSNASEVTAEMVQLIKADMVEL